jgi:hypothetical protein
MPVPDRYTEAAHRLWDELADRSIEHGDETLLYLLDQACRLIGADTAVWIGAVRLSDLGDDSLSGWRPRGIFSLHPSTEQVDQVRRRDMKLYARGEPDITTLRQVEGAGTWRVNRLVDLVPPEWFQSDYDQWRYKALGRDDAIWAVAPVNPDAECYYGIYRSSKHHRFTPEERDGFGYILRGLKWFHRRQMLGNGLLISRQLRTITSELARQSFDRMFRIRRGFASMPCSFVTSEYPPRRPVDSSVHRRDT